MIFLLDIARSKIFTRSQATQKLHFEPINSLAGAGAKYLQPKYRLKHEKQRHLVAKIKSRIFFVEALGPLNNSTTVFGRCYYLVKSQFFGISTPSDSSICKEVLVLNTFRQRLSFFGVRSKVDGPFLKAVQFHPFGLSTFIP